jgi:putative phage-type endonuclease
LQEKKMTDGCTWFDCVQGSDEWKAARIGRITASRFGDVMTNGRGGAASATARSYMLDLICESLTGLASDEITAKQLEWGKKHEPEARSLYSMITERNVDRVGFAVHGKYPLVGASSDGLVDSDGCIEVKCPFNSTVHLKTMMTGCVPSDYTYQVQGGLWVMGRQWCDFISYDPRMPASHRLVVIRVTRDETVIGELETRIEAFLGEIAKLTDEINAAARARVTA